MKLIELHNFGDDGFQKTERGMPSPCIGEVVIKVHAASLNFRDFMIAKGLYNPNIELPLVPLSDGAGEIVSVGNDVTEFNVGDRVMSVFWQDWNENNSNRMVSTGSDAGGVLTEYAVLPKEAILPIPEYMTYQEASTIPCAAVTAWTCIKAANIGSGDSVLLLGTGGVSILALQILKAMDANVIITSSSNEKLERAKELGADHTINYNENPEWGSEAFSLSNGGVNLVIEIGGESTFPQTINALTIGGHISVIGALSGINVELNLMQMVFKNVHVHGITVGSREDHMELNNFLEQHEIHPVIGKTVSIDKAINEIYGMSSGSHFGKIVIDISDD
tara:strand:+ start:6283 stop:7284 length:1002 start_codon:yes stop_codon:yes gene_type:complete